MKVYCVYICADTTEGRGPMILKEIFDNREGAEQYALSIEPYGYKNQFTMIDEKIVLKNCIDKENIEYRNLEQDKNVKRYLELKKKLGKQK